MFFFLLRLVIYNEWILGMLVIMTLIPIANVAAMFCAKYDGASFGRFGDRCLDAVFRYRDSIFYAPVLCRLTEAVFKIRFAPVGKQLSAVFLNSKIQYGPLAQLGERQVRNLEVRGSIPLGSTKRENLQICGFSRFLFCS